ncbi:type I methionyl aminopeptidase [Actinoalloteichus sp. AHMU CJ021]|uniref:Methionine aminopeptidase n=1 Tax=Actinoalloteichus caeruleus DSM 43889 TaxID=1120930 RepID=A0ABT1JHK2_ACTCY|nr:type I methionyl aminopeptidase [Actinoalloteichus caeruleus]AUS77998.1 type I methionyl aminopeptidase [Actinoalloteichus sp. AHMU CJ021]MCP2331977.1 methionyl aminopeptidase [Actinoalloteichus caeruleus DSM 43889]
MVELKTPGELEAMREAGRVVARALAAVRQHVQPGVHLLELDAIAHTMIRDAGAQPSFLGYRPHFAPTPFPGSICTSVNDVIVHGIPDRSRLAEGDLLSVDCGAVLDGWHGDSAISLVVGEARPEDLELIDNTTRAMEAGILAARVDGRLGDISAAIGAIGRKAGYGILRDFGGHGVGRALHEAPHLPNDGTRGHGPLLRPGLVLAIEPMFTAGGSHDHTTDADGWALRTADGSRAAHVEHTVAVTDDGPVVLTLP